MFSLIENFFINYGSWTVFMGALIEQFLPLPASATVLSSSAVKFKGVSLNISSWHILFFNILIPASIGKTIGSVFFYYMARSHGIHFIEQIGKYLLFDVQKVMELENKFKKNRFEIIFLLLARCLPIPTLAVNVFCGLIKYNFRNFIIVTFLGGMVQVFIWATLGWSLVNLIKI